MAAGETRSLAAVMFTDIVGYTALTQLNEAKALQLLNRHNGLLRQIFPRFRGLEIKTIGDSFLVEFESALDAANCAVEVQTFLRQDNAVHPPEDRVRIRVGIHLGDVVHTGADVFGDAVNIASRIQSLAEPEGVCVTGPVFDQVANKVPYKFERLEPKPLKNVSSPPPVYRVILPWSAPEAPLVARSARNRIAVLPFANMSPNPDDAYFADGMTEEIIAVLAGVPGLRVVSRTSVDPYKKREKPLRDIGAELHVDSVLEGSVRRGGDRVRITVQLIQTDTDEHLWAERYDRRLDDIFEVQTDIARTVAENLRTHLHADVTEEVAAPAPVASESYLEYLKGGALLRARPGGATSWLREARARFERAVAIDAGNARAYVGLADVAMLSTRYLREPRTEGLRASHRFVDKALELDPNLAEAHASRGSLFAREFRWSEAEQEFRRALAVNPSYATAHQEYAILLGDEGRLDEAVREMALAEEADPVSLILLAHFMQLLIGLGRLDEARAKLVRVGEIEGSAGAVFHECAAIYSLFTSDLASAREHVDWLKANVPEDPDTDLWYGMYTGLTHDRENAERAINQLEGLQDSYALRDQSIATVYALLGDWDECFAWLERGLKKRDLLVLRLRWNPLLTPVRKDPRFHDLLRRAQLQ